jgi:acetyltransferase-like isoleucine patch superfamily enzyme
MPDERSSSDGLADAIRSLYDDVDEALRERWDRSLPLQDALIDRWARARRLGFGPEASIYNSAVILGAVAVGRKTWIGPYTLLDGSGGGITIGDHCSISAGVHVYTHDTVRWSLSLGVAPRSEGAVVIGHGCHLGAQSVVAPAVSIGDHCVVGTNSFVNRSLPDRSVVVGSPARVVGRVEGDGADVRVVIDGAPGS